MGYRKALNWVAEVTAEHWTMMTSRLSKSKMALPCRISAFSPVDRLRQAVPQAPSEPPDRPSTDRRMDCGHVSGPDSPWDHRRPASCQKDSCHAQPTTRSHARGPAPAFAAA